MKSSPWRDCVVDDGGMTGTILTSMQIKLYYFRGSVMKQSKYYDI